jgi:hypothetical protein
MSYDSYPIKNNYPRFFSDFNISNAMSLDVALSTLANDSFYY